MKSTNTLPSNYKQSLNIDIRKTNKKLSIYLNLASFTVLIILVYLGGVFTGPFYESELFTSLLFTKRDPGSLFLTPLFLLSACFFMFVMNHILQYILLIILGSKSIKHNYKKKTIMKNVYGSSYLSKKSYIFSLVFPGLVISLTLIVCAIYFSTTYFWSFFFLLAMNISGDVGNFYILFKLRSEKNESYVLDSGDRIQVFRLS